MIKTAARILILTLVCQAVLSSPSPGFFRNFFASFSRGAHTLRTALTGVTNATSSAVSQGVGNAGLAAKGAVTAGRTLFNSTRTALGTALNATGQVVGSGLELGANLTASGLHLASTGISTATNISSNVFNSTLKVGGSLVNATGAAITNGGKLTTSIADMVTSGMKSFANAMASLGSMFTVRFNTTNS